MAEESVSHLNVASPTQTKSQRRKRSAESGVVLTFALKEMAMGPGGAAEHLLLGRRPPGMCKQPNGKRAKRRQGAAFPSYRTQKMGHPESTRFAQ
jgi:hypothetical protein